MERKERLEFVYNTLHRQEVVRSKKDFAQQLGINQSSLSSAFVGNEKYLTDNLLRKVAMTYPQFSVAFVTRGQGEPFATNNTQTNEIFPSSAVSQAAPSVPTPSVNTDDLLAIIKKQQEDIARLGQSLADALRNIDKLTDILANTHHLL